MKHMIFLSAGLIILSCGLLSCDQLSSDRVMISLLPSSSVTLATKAAVLGTEFPSTRSIRLSACHKPLEDGGPYDYFVDAKFERGRKGLWNSTFYWPSTGTLSFLGYSSESADLNASWSKDDASESFILKIPDNSVRQDDILACCADSRRKNDVTDIRFVHACALVTFKGHSDVDFDERRNMGVTLRRIVVRDAAFSGTLKVTRIGDDMDFEWSDTGSVRDREIDDLPMMNLNTEPEPVAGTPLLVIPAEQRPITIHYTLHMGFDASGEPVDRDMEYTLEPSGCWSPGTATNYTICITAKEINFFVSVAEWDERHQSFEF